MEVIVRRDIFAFGIPALMMAVVLGTPVLGAGSPAIAQTVAEASGENIAASLERRGTPGSARAEFSDEETRGRASREFEYGWSAEADAIPQLAAMLAGIRGEALAMQKAEWEQSITEFAEIECISCVSRSYSADWQTAAETPRLLVLQSSRWTYAGGAHGNSDFDALMWDREANDGAGAALRPVDMFAGETALENTAFGEYCQSLLEARGERLGMSVEEMSPFENCPSVSDLVVVPTSSNGTTFDGLTFYAAPYVAGSYADGAFVFDIPMTAALIAVLRPEYRSEFAPAQMAPK